MGQASRDNGEPCVEGMDLGVERGEQEERGTVMLRGLVSLRGDGLEVTASCVSLCFLPNLRGDGLTRIVSCVSVLQLLSEPCAFSLEVFLSVYFFDFRQSSSGLRTQLQTIS